MSGVELEFVPNSLYYGDCLDVLREWPAAVVDLVYLDPPFNSKANYNVLYGSANGASAQLRAFSDTWHWDEAAAMRMESVERAPTRRPHAALMGLRTILGESGMLAYLSYMAERLEACRRVMTDRASLYLHCDPTASHYLKALCDSVFGADYFRNEIVWKRTGAHSFGDGYARVPSHAAAAACLATSGPPAFRHPPSRALSVSPDTTGTAPRPARHVAPRPGSRHAGLPGRRGLPAPRRPSWPSWSASVRALPRMWRTVPCVDRVRCWFAARHWCSSRRCYHTPGSSSRQRRLWRPVCAGHLTTASSRRHQHSS